MGISIALVMLSLVGGSGPIPTEPGTTWHFENRATGKVVREKWEIVRLPADFSAWLIDEGDREKPQSERKMTGETPGFVGIEIDGKRRFLLRTLKNEQRLYSNGGWEGTYAIAFTLPRILKDGAVWKSAQSRLSCGWMVMTFVVRALREDWAAAPWDPQGKPSSGFRIEGKGSIVVVPGVGIVGMNFMNGVDHFGVVRVK